MKPPNECKTVLELFSEPNRWTKGAIAINQFNEKVMYDDDSAICFCLVGGINLVYDKTPSKKFDIFRAANLILWKKDKSCLTEFNDRLKTTHEDVIEFVKELGI